MVVPVVQHSNSSAAPPHQASSKKDSAVSSAGGVVAAILELPYCYRPTLGRKMMKRPCSFKLRICVLMGFHPTSNIQASILNNLLV
jgi:hypothetical protein